MRYYLVFILLFLMVDLTAQSQPGKIDIDITRLKIGVNGGPYRGRTATTSGPFDQGFAFIGQAYFPFQLSLAYKNSTGKDSIVNEYENKIFLIRPSALLHYVDNGSMAFGIAMQFSFLITKQFYLEYQLAGVYLEATTSGEPDLYDGFNLHHYASISKPISRHFSLSIGFTHLSGAGLANGVTSNQDLIALGLKWNL